MLHYTDGGLKNIWLTNGYEVKKTRLGKAIAIHDLDGLTKVICYALTNKANPLTGKEFRYLRSGGLLMSQDGLSKLIGADAQSIARWEKTGKVPKWADKFIRILYTNHHCGDDEVRNAVNRITTIERLVNQKIIISEKPKGGWKTELREESLATA